MSDDTVVRREAIHAGLKPFMTADDLSSALSHWEEHYADKPRFSLQGFVADLCQNGELGPLRTEIFISLVQAMRRQVNNSMQEPALSSRVVSVTGRSSTVLEILMDALITECNENIVSALHEELPEKLNTQKIPEIIIRALILRIEGNKDIKIPNLERSVLRVVLNTVYVLLCETAGPVTADSMLANAVGISSKNHPQLRRSIESLL